MAVDDSHVHEEQGFLSHLVELRDRLLKAILAVGVLFLALFAFSNDIYNWLARPLLKYLPDGQMIAIDVAAPFFIPFKLTLMLCVFLAIPWILYQAWAFVAPGLYTHEKRLVFPMMVSSTLLFYLGVAFAYFVVFPIVFGFFVGVAPEGVEVNTDIGRYLDFVITLFFAFGIAFEVPVATVLVVAVGITTPDQLRKIRPYVVVAAFIVGMFLTPPDIISQTLLALPMWLLYEIGILFASAYKRRIVEAGDARDRRLDGAGETPVAAGATDGAAAAARSVGGGGTRADASGAAVSKAGTADTGAPDDAPAARDPDDSAPRIAPSTDRPEEPGP